jgi:hypothetical protein
VTARRLRDLRRLLQAEAEAHGAEVRIERTSGSHLRGVFSVGGRETSIFMAWSPRCDYQNRRYVVTDARRALRGLVGPS